MDLTKEFYIISKQIHKFDLSFNIINYKNNYGNKFYWGKNYVNHKKYIRKLGYKSQCGEDLIVNEIFKKLNINIKNCLEFGARDGISGSNTFYFIKNNKAKTILIEGDKNYFYKLYRNFRKYKNVIPLNMYVDCEDNNIDKILNENNFPKDFDLLSIDIDSNDYWIWKSINNYKPKIVIIEFNPCYKESVTIKYDKNVRWNNDNYFGASAPALYKLGLLKGYDLIAYTHVNLIFIDKNLNNNIFKLLDINNINYYWRIYKNSDKQMISV